MVKVLLMDKSHLIKRRVQTWLSLESQKMKESSEFLQLVYNSVFGSLFCDFQTNSFDMETVTQGFLKVE